MVAVGRRRRRGERTAQEELFDPMAATALGRDVQRLTAWARRPRPVTATSSSPACPTGPGHQVSVSARECLGVARCPLGARMLFREEREEPPPPMSSSPTTRCWPSTPSPNRRSCPSTIAARRRRSPRTGRPGDRRWRPRNSRRPRWVSRPRRIARLVGPELTERLEAASATFSSAIHDATPGRIDYLDDELATYLTALRDAAARHDRRSIRHQRPEGRRDPRRGGRRAESRSPTLRRAS